MFETTYVRVVRQMADLGERAGAASVGTSKLDRSLAEAGASASTAAAGLGRADRALAGAGVSASEAAVATRALTVAQSRSTDVTTEAGLASSKLTQAQLRQSAAAARLAELQASDTASTRQLAAARASLVAANDRVALSTERVERSQMLGAASSDRLRSTWAAIPGPVKFAAAALVAVGVASIDVAKKFQDTTTRIGTQANATDKQVNALRAGILHMAATVATTPDVLADAAYHIASVGQKSMTTAQQLDVLRIAAEGAKIGHANLVDVTNALDAAIVANMKGVHDYSQVMGVMNATVGAGDMSMQNLADAFGPLGSTFKGFGVTIQQAGAALATFGDNNMRGADAGTQLRMSITALADPLKAGRDQLKKWGLTTGDLSAQLAHGGLTEALAVLAAKLRENGVTADTMGPKLAEMFGKRGPQQGLSTLINQLDRYNSKLHEVTTGGDTFASRWADYTKTLSYAWDRIRSGADAAAISIGNKLLPDATRALSWIGTTGVGELEAFGHALATNTTFTGGLHDLEATFGHVVDALRNAAVAAEPFAHALLTIGGGAALIALRLLAATLDGVATAIDDVTGFFAHNKAAAGALAGVLTATLIPALVRTGQAALAAGGEAGASGLWKIGNAASAAVLAINPATIALAALGAAGMVAWSMNRQAAQDAKKAADDYVASLHAQSDNLASLTSAAAALQNQIAMGSQKATGGAKISFGVSGADALHQTMTLASSDLDALRSKLAQYQNQAVEVAANEHALQTAYGLTAAQVEALAAANKIDLSGSLSDVSDSFRTAMAAVAATHNPQQQAAADLQQIGAASQTAADDVQALTNALNLMAGDSLSADQAAIAFRNDIASLDAALKSSHGSLSLNTTAGRAAREAFDQAAQQALSFAEAQAKLKGGNDKARASLEASVAALKAHAGGSAYAKHAIGELEAALAKLPATAKTAGVGMGAGLSQGIEEGYKTHVIRAVTKMADGTVRVTSTRLEMASPSKVFKRLGLNVADGFAIGIGDGMGAVLDAAKAMATAAVNAATGATKTVYATIAAAVAPTMTDPAALAHVLSTGTTSAVNSQNAADTAAARYAKLNAAAQGLAKVYDTLHTADIAAEQAARQHATALSNVAHAALRVAEAMPSATKAERASRDAAMAHARSLEDVARTASQAATALAAADRKREASAKKAADAAAAAATKAKDSYNTLSQAAQEAAQTAAEAARSLVASLQSATDQMAQQVSAFQQQISSSVAGNDSLTSVWQQLTGTDANGNPITPTLQGVQSTFDGILASAQQFSADLNTVVAEGASQDLIAQLAAMGTTAGDALAQQLIAAGPDAVKALQTAMDAIKSVADIEGDHLAGVFYGQGVNALAQLVAGMESQFPELKDALAAIVTEISSMLGTAGVATASGAAVTRAVLSAATGARSGAATGRTDPTPVLPHFAGGVRGFGGGFALVGELGPEIVRLPAGSNVYPHGSDGASLLGMGAVVDRLERIEARLADAPALTGQAVGDATLSGFVAAGRAQGAMATRQNRKL